MSNYNLSQEWLQAMEVDDFFVTTKKSATKSKIVNVSPHLDQQKKMSQASTTKNPVEIKIDANNIVNNANNIDELKNLLLTFDGCNLKFGAKNTVFADGNPGSKIMFIGEAPGATEDEKGIPFCGESGKLLDNMIATIGLSRQKNCYITNTVFWRPPANRAPTQEEIEICRPFVEKHISLIKPALLILVGSTAVSSLLGPNLQISKIRQEYYQYSNRYLEKPIMTTAIFHPAYLLRQPMQKKTSWYDLLKIRDYLLSSGIEI